MTLTFPFDIQLAKDTGTLVTGARQHGKSTLTKHMICELRKRGYIVKVFDVAQVWHDVGIPVVIIRGNYFNIEDLNPMESRVFDISRLYPLQQKEFVMNILSQDFAIYSENSLRTWLFYVLEEGQIVLPKSLKAMYAQEAMRTVSIGANYKTSYILTSQRPADLSTEAISRCGQLFIGKHFEENDIKKLSKYLGWKWTEARERLSKLQKGQFIRFASKPELIQSSTWMPIYSTRLELQPQQTRQSFKMSFMKLWWTFVACIILWILTKAL